MRLSRGMAPALVGVLLGVLLPWLGAGCGGGASEGVGGVPGSGGSNPSAKPECGAFGQACIGQGLDAPLAVGGRLEVAVAFQVSGSSGPPLVLEAVDQSVLQTTETYIEAVGPGCSAVLFVDTDGTVVDFIHVWTTAAEELRILRYSPFGDLMGHVQDQVQLLVGDEVLVAVVPYANAQPLLGNYTLVRDIVGDSVAMVPDPVGGWYRVVARSAGASTITFSGLGIEAVWDIEVLP
jgi:hypothetical protein